MELHTQSLDVVRPIRAAGEIRQVELNPQCARGVRGDVEVFSLKSSVLISSVDGRTPGPKLAKRPMNSGRFERLSWCTE